MTNLVATIVTSPEKTELNALHLNEAKACLMEAGAKLVGIKWLRPDAAFDIYFDHLPQREATYALADLQEVFDIAVQPEAGRLKKLLMADMDSTMITMESLDTLADELGFGAEVRDITDRGMRGELDFEESLRTRVGLLKDKPTDALDVVLDQLEYSEGAEITVKTLVAHGVHTALVSGGFTFTTEVVYQKLGFHEHHANSLLIENNKLTGFAGEPILGPTAKLDNLKRLCEEKKISQDDVCTVGDGANDIPMLKAAGLGVAYFGKPIVQENAPFKINHTNLTTLLYYQGIAYNSFAQL